MHPRLAIALALMGSCGGKHDTGPGTTSENQAPGAPGVTIEPDAPATTDDLRAVITDADDPDGDSLTYRYAWTLDGAETEYTDDTVPADATARDQTWAVTVVASDGTDEGPGETAEVTVVNSLPAATVSLTDSPPSREDLTATYSATDADGDAVSASFAWFVDDELAGDDSDTLDAVLVAGGSEIYVVVTPDDGIGPGEPATSNTVTVQLPVPPVPSEYAWEFMADFGPKSRPVDQAILPDGRILVIGLFGALYLYDPALEAVVGAASIGQGQSADAVSIELHPDFGNGTDDYLYVWHNMNTQIWRWHVSLGPFQVSDPVMLFEAQVEPTDGHSGGELLFWQGEALEPLLYLTIGDGQLASGQDTSTVFGSMVAFAVDNETATLTAGLPVPPFVNPLVAAAGVRNPWRIVDCGMSICLSDVGQNNQEELDLYYSAGDNFGWPDREGTDLGLPKGKSKGHGMYVDPYLSYTHRDTAFYDDDTDNFQNFGMMKAIWAGLMVGPAPFNGELEGHVMVSDHYDGWVRALYVEDPLPIAEPPHIGHQRYITSAIELPTGEIYLTELTGTLRRMVRRDDYPMVGAAGDALSSSSYPAGGIGYVPRYPFHEAGAVRTRFVQLPPETKIDNTDPEEWVFPVGTRVYKTLARGGRDIEVRVLEKTEKRWLSGVYIYDGADAYLSDGRVAAVKAKLTEYTVPSVSSCEECHGATRGRDWILGIDPFQLGDTGLAAFAPALEVAPGPAPDVEGDEITRAARGYLHSNCSFCHNADSLVPDTVGIRLDFSYDTAEGDMNAIGEPVRYHMDLPSINVILPGYPDSSAMIDMMLDRRMPPSMIPTPDFAGIDVVSSWIEAMGS